MKFEIRDLFKIPNILCYIRIILVPVFCWLFFSADESGDYLLAAGIVIISGITDFLDGQIARRCHMITDLGKIIDPFADKLMQFAMLVCLTLKVQYMYVLVIYLVIKEVTMAVTGLVVYKKYNKRLNGAKWYGKVCTAVLYLVMISMVAIPEMGARMQAILLTLCAAVLTLAFFMYIRIYIKMIRDTKAGKKEFAIY